MCGQGAGKRKGPSQVEGLGVLGLLGACRTTHNPKIKNKQTKTLPSAMKVPSTLKFQQRRCLCSERSCAAQVRSPVREEPDHTLQYTSEWQLQPPPGRRSLDPVRQGSSGTDSVTNSHLSPQPKSDMPKLTREKREE